MKLRTIAFNNLRRRKARMSFLVAGLLTGIATVVTLLSLTSALTMEAEHKLDSYGANILSPRKPTSSPSPTAASPWAGSAVDPQEIRQEDLAKHRDHSQQPQYRRRGAESPRSGEYAGTSGCC